MVILHTEWMEAKGGQTKRVLMDLINIREMGFVPILATKKNTFLYNKALEEGIKTYAVEFKHLADIRSLFKLLDIIRHESVDIVNTHSSKDSYVATFAAKFFRKKVVRSRHMPLTKKAGFLYKLADKLLVTGELLKKEFVNEGYDARKIVSIPSYPDSKIFNTKIFNTEKNENIVIGSMSGAIEGKRAYLVIELVKKLIERYPYIQYKIAGGGTKAEVETLVKAINEFELKDTVEYIGYVEDPVEFLSSLDIYICPSKSEGLPQALMQAMMMGVASISTDVGSISELNVNDNLILVDKDDVPQMNNELEILISDSEKREVLAQKNKEIMLKYFTNEVAKERLYKLYSEL